MPTKIPWSKESWNPIAGCSKCSPGCLNCYAERMAARQAHMEYARFQAIEHPQIVAGVIGGKYNLVIGNNNKWNGEIFCDKSALDKPLHWRKPRKVFVCSMSDLFHPKVPFEFIDKVFSVMLDCYKHTFQLLTKRPERALEYYKSVEKDAGECGEPALIDRAKYIHLGVSVCTPDEKDKIDVLRQIPATVKFVSFEPLLADMGLLNLEGIDWVIIGAESIGAYPGRRCELNWARNIIDQCDTAGDAFGIPSFTKQLHINGKLNKKMEEWPKWAQRQEYPNGQGSSD
jgi:protein gp37